MMVKKYINQMFLNLIFDIILLILGFLWGMKNHETVLISMYIDEYVIRTYYPFKLQLWLMYFLLYLSIHA